MSSRYALSMKRRKVCEVNAETVIERLKKVRALNCDPFDVGMDNFILKKVNRIGLLSRS